MTAGEVCEAIPISRVWQELGGAAPKHGRAKAFYRDGDGLSVSLCDQRQVWHDFVTGEGGGVLDLIQHVRGGRRKDALEWLADLAGIRLDRMSRATRRELAAARTREQREGIRAQWWAIAARMLSEQVLEHLPATNPERAVYTDLLSAIKSQPLAEYRDWQRRTPELTAAMVAAGAKAEETAQWRLLRWIEGTEVAA